jgi:Carboxymuconolactone decarboxylase family
MLGERIAASVAQRQVKYLTPVAPQAATGLVAQVYTQVADESRIVIPPALLHSQSPQLLAAYWMLMREPLVATGVVDRLAKEAVAAAVSVGNICPYCVDMHSTGMYDLSNEHDAEAIVRDRADEVDDPRVRTLAAWGRAAHLPDTPLPGGPPFPESHRPELVGVAVSFHYLTRMVNVFLSSFLLPPRLGPTARRRFKQGIGRMLAPTLRAYREPGRSLPLLPDAALPACAAWAAASPTVSDAAARSYAAFEAAGVRSVPPGVRELVLRRLSGWRGEETGLQRDWCEELILELPDKERAAARLALLTALASYQVDEEVVGEFRRYRPDDVALVETTAWASFAAARQVGMWHLPTVAATAQSGRTTPP